MLWLTPAREAALRDQLHTRCHPGKAVGSRMVAAWPGECCDSWGHLGPLAPRELHPWSHWWDSWWVLCSGMSLVAWQWVTAWGAAPPQVRVSQPCQRWPQAAAGGSAILAMQEKEISRSRMTPRSWAATSLSLPSLIPSTGRPASIPSLPGQQPVGRVQAQAGLRFLHRGAKSPETFLLIKV